MKQCLIVETRDPVENGDVAWMAEFAGTMHAAGVNTSVLLADNAVMGAREGVAPCIERLIGEKIPVWADRLAMRARGVPEQEILEGINPAEIDLVVDWLEAGASVLWR